MKKLLVALVVGALLTLPLSAMAMEKMSGNDLGGVTGQAGVTIAFGGDSATTVSFSALSWGDPDGISTDADADSAGWLIIDGDITIVQTIADGQKLTLDIATATADYTTTSNAVTIDSGKTFIAVGLPTITTDISVPDTLNIGLGTTAGTISGTLGILNMSNLNITQGTPDTLYIYAHE